MAWLRLFIVAFLMTLSCGVGAAAASVHYGRDLLRLSEERAGYKALADKAMDMSGKSLGFARKYQDGLNICLERLYGGPTSEPVVADLGLKKGGVGGPLDVRKQSRLP